ncbi:hypothetical protein LL912_02510 [Niabella sp. CC-SYL272]|uniref:hypothetical protein n=1 Tax=Niabella agricola TaxID=2891571 RepID=UPI001F21F877|nr:hypothetical protein [Niabella agricola]MCF3107643.1 hypothetical protein [Niabella agricola]
MNTEIQVEFLKDKIRELGTALFYDQSDQVLLCPTSFIKTFDFDLCGNICFFVERPYVDINGMHTQFPAQLHFHKKGVEWSIDLNGTASIDGDTNALQSRILVRFKILQAKCFYVRGQYSSAVSNLKRHIGYFIKKLYQDTPGCFEMAFE